MFRPKIHLRHEGQSAEAEILVKSHFAGHDLKKKTKKKPSPALITKKMFLYLCVFAVKMSCYSFFFLLWLVVHYIFGLPLRLNTILDFNLK